MLRVPLCLSLPEQIRPPLLEFPAEYTIFATKQDYAQFFGQATVRF
jgi:hypothetical protein